tara:strand:- start:3710 stop:3892 length:183 start_codon:yes stop_codon:yes gene_type:complete
MGKMGGIRIDCDIEEGDFLNVDTGDGKIITLFVNSPEGVCFCKDKTIQLKEYLEKLIEKM